MSKLTHDRLGYYIDKQLSENQALTREGFLLCKSVPIARTGDQLYLADEIGLDPRGDGLVKVVREADEVFRDETMASFEGKPVTIDHPDGEVNPTNWKQLTVGTVQNVRRGDGIQDDLLLADLLITDQRGIEAVRGGLREVSCGYDADYIQVDAGIGKQTNIIGNHVALVERGRAGPRCSIKDKEPIMKPSKKPTWLDKMRKFLDAEEEALKKEDETKDTDPSQKEPIVKTNDEDGEITARLDRIEAVLAKLVPVEEAEHEQSLDTYDEDVEEDVEEDEQTQDEGDLTEAETSETNKEAMGMTNDSLRVILSKSEILVPGLQISTNDSAKGAGERVMRTALVRALTDAKSAECVKPFLGKRDVRKLTGDSLAMVFNGAAELMRQKNNQAGVRSGVTTKDFGATLTAEALNAKNKAFWANR